MQTQEPAATLEAVGFAGGTRRQQLQPIRRRGQWFVTRSIQQPPTSSTYRAAQQQLGSINMAQRLPITKILRLFASVLVQSTTRTMANRAAVRQLDTVRLS